jgi:phosphoenolpyruvate carboxylase
MEMKGQNYSSLRSNVSLLGRILGEVIAGAEGDAFLEKIEIIRKLSKSARAGVKDDQTALQEILRNLDQEQLVPVARAFSQFLNLANIADQHHNISREMEAEYSASKTLSSVFAQLSSSQVAESSINEAIGSLHIELVLTAHPTEITRRTLIHKHGEIDACLGQLELKGRTEEEEQELYARLRELITQVWYGDDFRLERPSPVDEAKWGFAVVENSLWQAVPEFIRRLDTTLFEATGSRVSLTATPVTFCSWMGGDRDGNPNVTAEVTEEVLLLSRWQAADLYLQDVIALIDELSMTACNAELKTLADGAHEPYRAVLKSLRGSLRSTLLAIEEQLAGTEPEQTNIITTVEQLWQPLHCCYQSLLDCGMHSVADRALLDLLRRVRCFGVHLLRHDVRQEADRHIQVFSELTRYLELGDYEEWDESEKQAFLYAQLQNKRPLIPAQWVPSEVVREVMDTCDVIARQPRDALGAYVISMAKQPSDVLAVQLLLKEAGCPYTLPVVPLFETLDDLDRAPEVIKGLLSNDFYRNLLESRLMVMIGYSDSAKDAGVLAAAWAQYRAQESLLSVCADAGVSLTLFHGRGGTIGRGGAPAHAALLSQPPGSLRGGLRVTEQGEMIRTKLGLGPLAIKTLALYTSAILQANLLEPPRPKPEWRGVMESVAEASCRHYRGVVREEKNFVAYFRQATPEQELVKLRLGSRPARRKGSGGIESLRAIPWIFAWSQNRLMLPAWLGAGEALQQLLDAGQASLLKDMAEQWPFFATRLSMLEMVFAKTDSDISAFYDSNLVSAELQVIGEGLRAQLQRDTTTILALNDVTELLQDQAWVKESIGLRNIYIEPLNVLQAELLKREREEQDPLVEQAIMITIAGVAAGMRNTG